MSRNPQTELVQFWDKQRREQRSQKPQNKETAAHDAVLRPLQKTTTSSSPSSAGSAQARRRAAGSCNWGSKTARSLGLPSEQVLDGTGLVRAHQGLHTPSKTQASAAITTGATIHTRSLQIASNEGTSSYCSTASHSEPNPGRSRQTRAQPQRLQAVRCATRQRQSSFCQGQKGTAMHSRQRQLARKMELETEPSAAKGTERSRDTDMCGRATQARSQPPPALGALGGLAAVHRTSRTGLLSSRTHCAIV